MAVRDDRGDVKQTTTGFRGPLMVQSLTSAKSKFLSLVEVLKAYGTRPVRVEGHTDATASDEYNRELSERRAGAVRDWLEADGVAADRLTTVGHGEAQPVGANNTVAGRQLNRRVEVVVEKGETE